MEKAKRGQGRRKKHDGEDIRGAVVVFMIGAIASVVLVVDVYKRQSLGLLYFKGQGVDRSLEKAIYYARKALVKGACLLYTSRQDRLA